MPNPALLTYRDGSYNAFDPTEGITYENFEEWPGLTVWRIPYEVDLTYYYSAGGTPAIGSFLDPWGYFIRETPWRYTGDNCIAFERHYHNLPGNTSRPEKATKNYQAGLYTFAEGGITAMAVLSFSRKIMATASYHYALGSPGAIPVVPFIQVIPYLNSQAITDLGTGFPHTVFNPPAGGSFSLPDNNYAVSNLDESDVYHIFGNLYCRKILTG